MAAVVLAVVLFAVILTSASPPHFKLGVGVADVTGPAAEINMMGYAKRTHITGGIHLRQFSRAFLFEDVEGTRVVIVAVETCMMSQLVKSEVIRELQRKHNDTYTDSNVLLSATHTHSVPGGFLQYLLYLVPSQGFVRDTFDSLVRGIVQSIERAHNSMRPGHVWWNSGLLLNTSVNRSPSAYVSNPPEERDRYHFDVDKTMILLKLTDLENRPIGALNWFAVHTTSMNHTNKLISSDNKGYAALQFEKMVNGPDILPGKGPFVAGFLQGSEGDVSPKILGAKCVATGEPCDPETSTCRQDDTCLAFGPGKDMFESTKIIGERQFEKAWELFSTASERLHPSVEHIHQFVDMTNVEVTYNDTFKGTTCLPALGYSFAAGTTDSPGEFDFYQGATSSSRRWNLVRDLVQRPSRSLKLCHFPKPILLATGEMSFPVKWQPEIVPTQIVKLGKLALIAMPAEVTTMSGRRLKEAVEQTLDEALGTQDTVAVVTSLSNDYSSYVATYEEYQVQRYEGASTIYGPHTLQAYVQQFSMLAGHLAAGLPLLQGPTPPSFKPTALTFKPNVIFNAAPFGKPFGAIMKDVAPIYLPGSKASASFVSGHPRNDLRLEDTFLTVERWVNGTSSWKVIATDANWETKFYWSKSLSILGEVNEVTVAWDIPDDIPPGLYRLRHFGQSKNFIQQVKPYNGTSSVFRIVPHQPVTLSS